MRLFEKPIPYLSATGDKIYPTVVDIRKGITQADNIQFMSADNKVGFISVQLMDGVDSYSIAGSRVICSIIRPDTTQLEIPCDIISDNIIEIPLDVNGTYIVGVHNFDIKIYKGGKTIATPQMSYVVNASIESDNVVEDDNRLPILTTIITELDLLTSRVEKAITANTQDLEVKLARQSISGTTYDNLCDRLDAMELNPFILFEEVEG